MVLLIVQAVVLLADCPEMGTDLEARRQGCEGLREPGLGEREKELSRRRHSSTFRHSAWRVKGIIPSPLHPAMLSYRVKAMSHAGLKHCIKCSYPRVLKLVLNLSLLISQKTLVLCRRQCAFSSCNQKQFFICISSISSITSIIITTSYAEATAETSATPAQHSN